MSVEKPWNDVADQLRPAEPEVDDRGLDEEALVGSGEPDADPSRALEADPADVADQQRVVPLPDDEPWV